MTQNGLSKLNIDIDGNKIKQVDKQKLLGVFIDENLLWTPHIDYLYVRRPTSDPRVVRNPR